MNNTEDENEENKWVKFIKIRNILRTFGEDKKKTNIVIKESKEVTAILYGASVGNTPDDSRSTDITSSVPI